MHNPAACPICHKQPIQKHPLRALGEWFEEIGCCQQIFVGGSLVAVIAAWNTYAEGSGQTAQEEST